MDWLLCAFHNFSDHLFLIIREPGYWYQQPLSDYKKCQIAVCSSWAYGTHWDPQWQPDTTGVVITPLQQIHIDNRGQPACRSLMGLGWGCPIDCLFVRGIHRSPVYAPHKGHWCGALMFSLIRVWINGWVKNRATDDLRRHRDHYDVTVMRMIQ